MPLACETIVYRILNRKPTRLDGTLKARDFLLKAKDRDDGLSVFTSIEHARNGREHLRDMDGIVSLHVGHIRDMSDALRLATQLSVEEWPEEDLPGHAVIRNLPFPDGGDQEQIKSGEQIARELANMARPVPEP